MMENQKNVFVNIEQGKTLIIIIHHSNNMNNNMTKLHHKTDHLGSYCIECIEYHDEKSRSRMYEDLESGKVEQKSLF